MDLDLRGKKVNQEGSRLHVGVYFVCVIFRWDGRGFRGMQWIHIPHHLQLLERINVYIFLALLRSFFCFVLCYPWVSTFLGAGLVVGLLVLLSERWDVLFTNSMIE